MTILPILLKTQQKLLHEHYELIYNQITKWLKADKDLVEWIINQDSQEYRATTNEVLVLFNWLKRFADGMIEKV